jgi:23S rRNA pseudouridine955/2504/2580 synthase
VGDDLYGGAPLWLSTLKTNYRLKPGKSEQPLIGRMALHAEQLTLRHPATDGSDSGNDSGNLRIEAPWPKDLAVAVKYLRRYGGHYVNTTNAGVPETSPSPQGEGE